MQDTCIYVCRTFMMTSCTCIYPDCPY
jgi:hypothetical protein